MSNPHDFFKNIPDYSIWDNHVAHCEALNDLTSEDKKKFAWAIKVLRTELGETFLQDVIRDRCPFSSLIFNTTPWTRKKIVDFAHQLSLLKTCKRYPSLLRELRRTDNHREFMASVSVMHVAQDFFSSGLAVEEIHARISGFDKRPDLRVNSKLTGETIYVEVSRLGESVDDIHKSDTFHIITMKGLTGDVIMWGAVHDSIRSSDFPTFLSKIGQAIKKVGADGFEEIIEDGVVEIAMASENRINQLEDWADRRNLRHDFFGPIHDTDDLQRLCDDEDGKIARKQTQLPKNFPGVIVIDATSSLLFLQYGVLKGGIHFVAEKLRETISKYPHVFGISLFGQYGGPKNQFPLADSIYYTERTKYDVLTEQRLFVMNPNCSLALKEPTVQDIRRALN